MTLGIAVALVRYGICGKGAKGACQLRTSPSASCAQPRAGCRRIREASGGASSARDAELAPRELEQGHCPSFKSILAFESSVAPRDDRLGLSSDEDLHKSEHAPAGSLTWT